MRNNNKENNQAPPLSIIQWNARSMLANTRLDEFRDYLHKYNPMIALISETFWKESSAPSFSCYEAVRHDRVGQAGGGVAVLVHSSLRGYFTQLPLPETPHLETVGITISTKEGPIDIISAYCPHGDCTVDELTSLFESLQNEFFVGGDFNAHHVQWESNCQAASRSGNSIAFALLDLPDIALLTPPDLGTRVDDRDAHTSTIDLSFSSSALSIDADDSIGEYIGSDHLPVHTTIPISPIQAGCRAPRWIFNDNKWPDWNKCLSSVLNAANFKATDPEIAYDIFFDALTTASRDSFRVSSSDPAQQKEGRRPYIDHECLEKIQAVHDAHKNWRDHIGISNLRGIWKNKEAKKKRKLKSARRKSWATYVSELNPKEPQTKV